MADSMWGQTLEVPIESPRGKEQINIGTELKLLSSKVMTSLP